MRRAERWRLTVLGCTIALAVAGAAVWDARAGATAVERAPTLVQEVAAFGPSPQAAGARFTIDAEGAARTRPRPGGRALAPLAARAARRASGGADPEAMHAAALIDLRWGDAAPRTQARAESQLAQAAQLASDPAPIHADLSAAYLLRAARTGSGRALLLAIESAERALALDSASTTARYNLMLALDRLGCSSQARHAARTYLALDSGSAWAGRARRLASAGAVVAAPDPERARREGWDDALARWASAVLAGDRASAATALARARWLGGSIADRGGDRSLLDAVLAIDSARGPARPALARAHLAFAEGSRSYDRGAYHDARRRFARARAGASPPLALWARAMVGAARVHEGDPSGGGAMLARLLADVDGSRYPALSGRAHATLGTSLLRRGLDTAATRHAAAAGAAYAAAGERENLGSVQMLRAELTLAGGDLDRGFDLAAATLATLRDTPGSLWRHPMLGVLALETLASGLPRAAEHVQDEDVDAAARSGRPSRHVEALLLRVGVEAATGSRRHSTEDLRDAGRLLAAMPPGIERAWSEANLSLATALAGAEADPARAAREAGAAVAFFRRTSNRIRLIPALAARADAHVAAGRMADALDDLSAASAVIGSRAERVGSLADRAMLLAQARRVLARAVLLQLTLGRSRDALVTLEQTRALLATGTGTSPRAADPRRWLGPGEVGVAYLQVADTLLIWTVARGEITLSRNTVDASRLATTLALARTLLEHRASEERVRPVLAELYDVLVRPIERRLGALDTPLVFAVDGGLAAVPFAGLYDARRGQYLVERHALRFVTSLAEGGDARAGAPSRGDVVLVGAPELDPEAFGALAPLPGAAAEVAALRDIYRQARTLSGPAATAEAVLGALRGAEVLHYAGHAVFDDVRPEQSFLALAGAGPGARLSGARLAAERFSNARLVVLSACETLGGASGGVGGTVGLAGALRSAGAAGVVASAWRVDDDTALPLMVAFHREFRASGRAPEALRAAQRRMLASSAALRSPSTWAALRLVGS